MVFEAFVDPILGWTLQYPLWVSLLILAFIFTLIINVVYKYATDQNEMKRLKTKLKDYQSQLKEHRSSPKKMSEIQSKLMKVNLEYMKHSLRPMLYTALPLLIFFGWMALQFSFNPILPGEEVVVTVEMRAPERLTLVVPEGVFINGSATRETIERQASWRISADREGEFLLNFTTEEGFSAQRSFVVGSSSGDSVVALSEPFRRSFLEYPKATPFGSFSIFGYQPGWLFTYILFSIVLSLVTRKLMRLH